MIIFIVFRFQLVMSFSSTGCQLFPLKSFYSRSQLINVLNVHLIDGSTENIHNGIAVHVDNNDSSNLKA